MAIVCHCERVSDRVVRKAIAAGADTVDDVTERCGAGGCCGGCRPAIAEMLVAAPVAAGSRWASFARS